MSVWFAPLLVRALELCSRARRLAPNFSVTLRTHRLGGCKQSFIFAIAGKTALPATGRIANRHHSARPPARHCPGILHCWRRTAAVFDRRLATATPPHVPALARTALHLRPSWQNLLAAVAE